MKLARSLVAALALAGVADAQEEPKTPDAYAAEVIISALAPSDYGDWAYDWGAVSIRISSLVRWHLPDPDKRDRPADETIERNGWFSTRGRQVSVTAYGNDEAVTSLSFDLADSYGSAPPQDGLLEALRAEGATITLESEREGITDIVGPSVTYRLSYPNHDSAQLIRTTGCTSPKSRAAQRCWATYELALGRK